MKNKLIRCFIAIDLPKEVKEKIYKSINLSILRWPKYARIVNPNNYHITLKFLGEISENKLEHTKKALKKINKSKIDFNLKFLSTGIFPLQGIPRILWLGFKDIYNNLESIYRETNYILQPLGFKKEKREFTPHITLCRFKNVPPNDIEYIRKLPEKLNNKIIKDMKNIYISITSLTLFKSELTPDGSIYSILYTFSK